MVTDVRFQLPYLSDVLCLVLSAVQAPATDYFKPGSPSYLTHPTSMESWPWIGRIYCPLGNGGVSVLNLPGFVPLCVAMLASRQLVNFSLYIIVIEVMRNCPASASGPGQRRLFQSTLAASAFVVKANQLGPVSEEWFRHSTSLGPMAS